MFEEPASEAAAEETEDIDGMVARRLARTRSFDHHAVVCEVSLPYPTLFLHSPLHPNTVDCWQHCSPIPYTLYPIPYTLYPISRTPAPYHPILHPPSTIPPSPAAASTWRLSLPRERRG